MTIRKAFILTAFFSGFLLGQEAGTFSIYPQMVPAQSSFSLLLGGSGFYNCGSVYPYTDVQVDGNTITLVYVHNLLDVMCPAIYDPALPGPVFKIESLEAGKYAVYAQQTYECLLQKPLCRMALPAPVLVDTLVVDGGENQNYYYLSSVEAMPDQPFDLQLLNPSLGNCNSSFRVMEASIINGNIHLGFVHDFTPEKMCLVDIRPHGPVFEMNGLPAGEYKVFFTDYPSCAFPVCDVEPCAVCDIMVFSQYAGQLVVGATGIRFEPEAQNVSMSGDGRVFTLQTPTGFVDLFRISGELQVRIPTERAGKHTVRFTVPETVIPGKYILEFSGFSGRNSRSISIR